MLSDIFKNMGDLEAKVKYLKMIIEAIGSLEPDTYPAIVLYEEFKKRYPETNYLLFRSMLEVLEEIGAAELGIDEVHLKPNWTKIVNSFIENAKDKN